MQSLTLLQTVSAVLPLVIFTCTEPDNSMCASLPGGPSEFKEMEASFVADATSNAVRRLRNWMPMERQLVVLLDKNVVRPKNGKRKMLNNYLKNGSLTRLD